MELFGLTFIMFAGAVVVLIGMLMLMFAAFSTSAAWGIASLLLPPLAIGFGLTHWSKAKNGLAVALVGTIILGYGSWDDNQKKRIAAIETRQQSAVFEPSDLSQKDSAPGGTANTPTDGQPVTQTPASAPPALTPPPGATPNANVAPTIINMIDAHKFIDNDIRVTTTKGTQRIGILVEVRKDGIVLEYMPAGVKVQVRTEINEEQIHLMELVHQTN